MEHLEKILDTLKTVEETGAVKLGPKGASQRKHENVNNFALSYIQNEDNAARKALVESAKIRNV